MIYMIYKVMIYFHDKVLLLFRKMNEPRKAEALLLDSLNAYLVEGWGMLADDTLLELVKCYARLDDFAK